MALDVAPLLYPFTIVSNIFTLKNDIAKTHFNNVGLNVLDNAPLAVYYAVLTGNSLVMGLKTDNSPIDKRLSKMKAAIENIMSLVATGNLMINQLMEPKATVAIIAKAASTKKPQWTIMMAKNVHQVVS
jgi:hypothetical protein